MDSFEDLLARHGPAMERYVRFRLCDSCDWEDVVQDVYTLSYTRFDQLKDRAAFRSWLLAIARNQCAEYFRRVGKMLEVPIDDIPERELACGNHGRDRESAVEETMARLTDVDRQILEMYYWQELPQSEIAGKLRIPLGTVKSRLHTAKARFKGRYPHPPGKLKGEHTMKKLPKLMPEYTITPCCGEPFEVKWEELMGWFLVPKVGEKLCWGMYDQPSRQRSDHYEMEVTGKAKVHGIEGVEIVARETDHPGKPDDVERVFVAQLTASHCRYLAALRTEGEVRNYITFLDEDIFMPTWGFGENNCGHETMLLPKGDIVQTAEGLVSKDKKWLLDVVGRYTVSINGREYDTVCLVDMERSDCNVCAVQYIDRNGRTVLWRRFNRDDWANDRFGGKRWSEKLPDNDRLYINGKLYVHWYDCLTDYVL